MARLPQLTELVDEFIKPLGNAADERIATLLADSNDENRMLGFLLKAALALHRGGAASAINELKQARSFFNCIPLAVILNLINLCWETGREQEAADACLDFVNDAVAMGYVDLALRQLAAIMLDAQGQFEILKRRHAPLDWQKFMNTIATSMLPHVPQPDTLPAQGPPWHVALVVSNLVDHVVSLQRPLHFARYANREEFKLTVISSENIPPLQPNVSD